MGLLQVVSSSIRPHRLAGRETVALNATVPLGKGSVFVDAVADFGEAYADQNDADYALFKAAIDDGRLEAVTDE